MYALKAQQGRQPVSVMTDNQGVQEFVVGLLTYILEKLLKKIRHICILCVDLELACNGEGISLKRDFVIYI